MVNGDHKLSLNSQHLTCPAREKHMRGTRSSGLATYLNCTQTNSNTPSSKQESQQAASVMRKASLIKSSL